MPSNILAVRRTCGTRRSWRPSTRFQPGSERQIAPAPPRRPMLWASRVWPSRTRATRCVSRRTYPKIALEYVSGSLRKSSTATGSVTLTYAAAMHGCFLGRSNVVGQIVPHETGSYCHPGLYAKPSTGCGGLAARASAPVASSTNLMLPVRTRSFVRQPPSPPRASSVEVTSMLHYLVQSQWEAVGAEIRF